MKKPNILFIFTDQQVISAMSNKGNPYVSTPNIDRLAKEGVSFENSYCTSPVCSPSRSSLFTSRMPHETGVNINNLQIDESIPNMGEIFREAGYETAYTGKWHLPEYYPQKSIRGFDVYQMKEEKDMDLGIVADQPVTDEAIKFIKKPHDGPWLLTISLENPHDIAYWCFEEYMDKLSKDCDFVNLQPLPSNFDIERDEPDFITWSREQKYYQGGKQGIPFTKNWGELEWRKYLFLYYRLVEKADDCIGQILNALEEESLEDETLIVFTSDHGEGVAEHQWVGKLSVFQAAIQVPLILKWKEVIPAGLTEKKTPVSGLDILPTMVDYASIYCPYLMQGKSLKKIVEGQIFSENFVVVEVQPDDSDMDLKARVLITEQYKYILFSKGAKQEMLFDLIGDPEEKNDISQKNDYLKILIHHRDLLQKWIEETDDDFVGFN